MQYFLECHSKASHYCTASRLLAGVLERCAYLTEQQQLVQLLEQARARLRAGANPVRTLQATNLNLHFGYLQIASNGCHSCQCHSITTKTLA